MAKFVLAKHFEVAKRVNEILALFQEKSFYFPEVGIHTIIHSLRFPKIELKYLCVQYTQF